MKKLLIVLAVLAVLPVASASADTISYTWGPYDNILISNNGGTSYYSEASGVFVANWNGKLYDTFCVDLFSSTYIPTTQGDVVVKDESLFPGSATNPPYHNGTSGGHVAWLINEYWVNGAKTNANAATVQAAIWALLYDNFRLDSNSPYYVAATQMTANARLHTWEGLWFDDQDAAAGVINGQDTMTAVPEPSSMLLLGTALFGLAAAARRRNK